MSAEWHYTSGGQQVGPVSAAELKSLARAGKLAPTDMLWKEGMSEWRPASSVKELFPAPAPSVSSPPSPPSSSSPAVAGTTTVEVTSGPPHGPESVPAQTDETASPLSFLDKVKGRLSTAVGSKGASKIAGAGSFLKKHRLWTGIGTGVAACVILILLLLPRGTLPGGKKSYTQR